MKTIIEAENICKTFGSGGAECKALDGISLEIKEGEFVSIVGRSGSGKSTFMHLCGGLDKPDSGKITVNGTVITDLNANKLADFRCKNTGFVFQAFHLEPKYTVFDNISVPLLISNTPKKEIKEKVNSVLEQVGLTDKIKIKTAKLSGGEKQRIAIARAIINNPPIIFADEPCGNLDSTNSDIIMTMFEKLNSEGKTIILVTHNMADAKRTKRIITFKDGKKIDDKTN